MCCLELFRVGTSPQTPGGISIVRSIPIIITPSFSDGRILIVCGQSRLAFVPYKACHARYHCSLKVRRQFPKFQKNIVCEIGEFSSYDVPVGTNLPRGYPLQAGAWRGFQMLTGIHFCRHTNAFLGTRKTYRFENKTPGK